MKNTVAHSVLEWNPDLATDKKDKANHGYGTRISREIAAKHKGFADFYGVGNECCCNIEYISGLLRSFACGRPFCAAVCTLRKGYPGKNHYIQIPIYRCVAVALPRHSN